MIIINAKQKNKYFRYFGYNTYRLITSGAVLLFVTILLIKKSDFLFSLPVWAYVLITLYYAIFPIKDMFSSLNKTLYKGKQFKKNYAPNEELSDEEFFKIKKKYDRGALRSIVFWLAFMAVVGILHSFSVLSNMWIVFFFTFSDFCVYFAIFFWCPFHKILVKPQCCMDCRIFNWDSFFSFSFLIFIPSPISFILVFLSLVSLVEWEITYHKYPRRFFVSSNKKLSCENCDMEHCKNRKEKMKAECFEK